MLSNFNSSSLHYESARKDKLCGVFLVGSGENEGVFSATFDWEFEDYGPDYAAFTDVGLNGGFFRGVQAASTEHGSPLVVLFSANLEGT